MWYTISNMKPVTFISIKDQVVEELIQEFLSGNIKPGQKLHERKFAESLAVSRTPVREAFIELANIGLLMKNRNSGWIVIIPNEADIQNIFELRLILEMAGLEKLLQADQQTSKNKIVAMFDEFNDENINNRIDQYIEIDNQFHKSLVNACKNDKIREIYENTSIFIQFVRRFISYQSSRKISLQEHNKICNSLKNSNIELSKQVLKKHIERVRDEFISLLNKMKNSADQESA